LRLFPKVPKKSSNKAKALRKRRTSKDSKCRQENRLRYFYELWLQSHGQMEAAVRELCSAHGMREGICAAQHRAPHFGAAIAVPRCHRSPRPGRRAGADAGIACGETRGTRGGQEAAGWQRARSRDAGTGRARRPCCRAAAKPACGDAAAPRSLGSARVRSRAACESQLCTTRCPLPSPSNRLEYYFYYYSSLLSLWFFFFPPSSFFDSLAVSPLAKISSAHGRELRRAKARADRSACQPQPQPQPQPAPTAAAEKQVGCGLLFSTHSTAETP